MNIPSPEFAGKRDDTWISCTCTRCYGTRSILAHRVDGAFVEVEGDPESAIGKVTLVQEGTR